MNCLRTAIAAAAIALLAPAVASGAQPGATDWAENAEAAVRLVSASTATGGGETVSLALEFRLQKGWKVYWRSPGDAGFPPSVDWQGSENLAGAEISWPLPHRFEVLGMQTIGYKDAVTLPITARLDRPGEAAVFRGAVDYLVCDSVCIPHNSKLELALPGGPGEATPFAHAIGRAVAAVPGDGAPHGLSVASVEGVGTGKDAVLRVVVAADPPFRSPDLFAEGEAPLQFQAPTLRLEAGGRRAVFEAPVVSGTLDGPLAGQPVVVTVGDGTRSLEARTVPVAGAAAAPIADDGAAGLAAMLGFALLGGLILNLMPCVLPVLSIKVLGLIGHGGGERRHIRLSFVAASAGILVSFLALAAAAVAVKAAGAAVGWGIQFQQPLFVVGLVVVLTLFAGNMWGLFEIPLPHWLAGVGHGYGRPHSLSGHFFSGAFATLLATPCTAPFLGTAIGFALSRGPVEIFAIFAALGLGMSLPYLAVAAWPQVAQRLPRPGRWMLRVRQLMGFALAATAVWLLMVLAAQKGEAVALAIGGLMAAVVAVLALRLRLPGRMRPAAAAAVLALSGLAFVAPFQATSTSLRPSKDDTVWAPFARESIAPLVAEGKTVFVDVTADWCITCQVNKATVLTRGAVAERLKGPGMVAMRADWTRPDDGIAAYLASFGRYGIPFNAVYGPGAPDGIALSELLTPDAVLTAMDQAAARN